MGSSSVEALGYWQADASEQPAFSPRSAVRSCHAIRRPAHIIADPASGSLGVGLAGAISSRPPASPHYPLIASLPPIYPEWLGERAYLEAHRVRFPYIAGAMANGIATSDLVIAMARAGMLGFFGAGGLSHRDVVAGIERIQAALGIGEDAPAWGANLIHSPNEPELEEAVAELYITRGVRRVSASAYMKLTPAIVRVACAGLRQAPDGSIVRGQHVFAKISRRETAEPFMRSAPQEILDLLVARGHLSTDEARLAQYVPVASDVTAEADSGGHTDNRALTALLPDILRLRDQLALETGFSVRVGAAGGIGTPQAVAAAFNMGAAYVLTGSVNQAALESGLAPEGKAMLVQAESTDVIMAPAPDMFELGVEVQVLQRGTLFAKRAEHLRTLYRTYDGLEMIPAATLARLEDQVFRASIDAVWAETRDFWARRNPRELARAEAEPKHRMALMFRWYVGKSSRWAIAGDASRRLDYQIWCGPAMGSFNTWAQGSFLAEPANRTVVQIALNLLEGAATITRAQQLRSAGVALADEAFDFRPRPLR